MNQQNARPVNQQVFAGIRLALTSPARIASLRPRLVQNCLAASTRIFPLTFVRSFSIVLDGNLT